MHRTVGALGVLAILVLTSPIPAGAGSKVITIQSTSGAADAYIKQDNPNENNGTKPELRIKGSASGKVRNALVDVPITALTGYTVVQAWLRLTEFGASNSEPIDARVYPLTETWDELQVSWNKRSVLGNWSTPGGTHGPYWTGRALISAATNGEQVGWQVGPILSAWQTGDLPNDGLVIPGDTDAPDREVVFRSSDYTNTPDQRPQLVVYVTDEPPAVRRGWAEVQPPAVRVGATNTPLSFWLDLDAVGSTPSGAATGVDVVAVTHGTGLGITTVSGVTVGGVALALGQFSWSDDGNVLTVHIPRVRAQTQVRIDVRVNVVTPASVTSIELPVAVDDSATPGAWAQALWPRNADGIAGNGDTWLLAVTSQPPASIDLTPSAATVGSRLSTQFDLFGVDGLGNRFAVDADSMKVVPAARGTITSSGRFTGGQPGTGSVLAYLSGMSDASQVVVTPALVPAVGSLTLRTRAGTPTATLVPRDTMLLDVPISDGDGFKDVQSIDIALAFSGHAADMGAPAFHAAARWTRGGTWSLLDPTGCTWALVPSLCSIDTSTNATTAQTVRLAFVVGRIARASSTGEWSASIRAVSLTPPDTSTTPDGAWNAAARLDLTAADSSAAFSPGRAGVSHLALRQPVSAKLGIDVVANTPWRLEAAATPLVGTATTSDTLQVAGGQAITWAIGPSPGALDTMFTALLSAQPAFTSETPVASELALWIDHPAVIVPQDYVGSFRARARAESGAATSSIAALPLTATVVGAGQAATSAVAEVLPNSVQVGVTAQSFTASILPQFQSGDSGIDHLLVRVPDGYGTATVTAVRVAGLPVAFTDVSAAGVAAAMLGAHVNSASLIEVVFRADTPIDVDPAGADFAVQYDDASTALLPQAANEGNANGLADGDDWRVTVTPGPVASIVVTPDTAVCFLDSTVTFAAVAHDAWGHDVPTATITWSADGGIGTVDGTGAFHATATGAGRVIVHAGAVADTASVTVRPVRGLVVHRVLGPSSFTQGDPETTVQVRIENLGAQPVSLGAVTLHFTSGATQDVGGDFVVGSDPANATTIEGGERTALAFHVAATRVAATGALVVNASASGTETGSGITVADAEAETTLATAVARGGFTITATQVPVPLRPGAQGTPVLSIAVANESPTARRLESLVLANRTTGPGTPDQLDAELGDLTLHLDDGDGVFDPAHDTPLQQTLALGGAVHFTPLDVAVSAGESIRLFVALNTPLAVREGDALDVRLADTTSVEMVPAGFFRQSWPVDPVGTFPFNAMTAAQIALSPTVGASALTGAHDRLVLDVTLPANGYTTDLLQRLAVVQLGTAVAGGDIIRVRAWADNGDGAFSVASDWPLGDLTWTGNRFERTGLSTAVPLTGLRVFFTADIADLATEGRTLRFALPAAPDVGVGMASDASGPLDRGVENPFAQAITTVDRVTLAASRLPAALVHPGQHDVVLHHLTLTNDYADPRTLTTLTYHDATTGVGPAAAFDGEIESLVLRADGDGDGVLGDVTTDPVLGTAFFSLGQATFAGLDWTVASGATSGFFLVASVSRTQAADGDVLSATLAGPGDVAFAEPTTLTGAWPVDSQARATIDGMVATQITVASATGGMIAPGDGPVLALDLVVPRNGYVDDTLTGLRVVNLGTAAAADIAELRLWRDGGDGVFSAGGDDQDLGALGLVSGAWQSPPLAAPLTGSGARLFVALRTAAGVADSATVRLAVPVNGIAVGSGDDGPLDTPIPSPQALLVSRSALLASLEIAPAASVVGQTVTVRMIARNAGGETVTGVVPDGLDASGDGSLAPVSGPMPAQLDLVPAARDTFTWTFTAAIAGDVALTGACAGTGATSGLARRSLAVRSNTHQVYASATALGLLPVQSMPSSVDRGRTDVIPLSLTFDNPGGPGASPVRLRAMRIRLEDENGQGIVPASLLTRVVVNEGTDVYLTRTSLETSGDEMDLTLSTPAIITGLEPTTLSLRLDVSASATAPSFRVVIVDSTRMIAEEAISGAPVNVVLRSGAFPVRSGFARLVEAATRVDATGLGGPTARVARGTGDVQLLAVRLENPGVLGISSDVRVAAFGVVVCDTTGAPVARPLDWIERVRVHTPLQTLGTRTVTSTDSAAFQIALAFPFNLPPNAPLDLTVAGDIAAGAAPGAFRLVLRPASYVDARDASTHVPVPTFYDTDPIRGPAVRVETPAESLLARGTPSFPATARVGDTNLTALTIVLRHPGTAGTARVRVDSLRVDCHDRSRNPLPIANWLGRAGLVRDGVALPNPTGIPATGSTVTMSIGGAGLEPGDSTIVRLVIDVAPTAPLGAFELGVATIGLYARDVDTDQPVRIAPMPGADLPLFSGVTQLTAPPRDLAVDLTSRMPAAVTEGDPTVAARLTLTSVAPAGSGAIDCDRLTVRASRPDGTPLPIGAVASRVSAWIDGSPWATSATLSADSTVATLVPGAVLGVVPETPQTIEIRFVPRDGAAGSGFRLGCDAGDVSVTQPASVLLAVTVRAATGRSFPLWTETAGFTPARLAASYANFPNPFAAGRQSTAFVYYLTGAAHVTLRLYTPQGDPVATVLDGAARAAGLQQDDHWDGRNGAGGLVRNGVYVAELTVRYDAGDSDRVLRKVAVVR